MIRRYNIGMDYWGAIYQSDSGEWVKWEDVEPIIRRHDNIINSLVIDDSGARIVMDGVPSYCKSKGHRYNPEEIKEFEPVHSEKKCNCVDMCNRPGIDFWICPAHGYKRR